MSTSSPAATSLPRDSRTHASTRAASSSGNPADAPSAAATTPIEMVHRHASSNDVGGHRHRSDESPSDLIQLLDTATPALVSGAFQAVLFNPFDRALYVRVQTRRRRFLDRRNFERPFQGFGNAAAYRTIVGSSYIFWQDSCRIWIPRVVPWLDAESHPALNAVSVGLVAGAVNGLALNNLQAVKFRMWSEAPADGGRSANGGFFRTARHMYATGGVPVFFRGCIITMQRDAMFGVMYEGLRRSEWFKGMVRVAMEPWVLFSTSTSATTDDAASATRVSTDASSSVQLSQQKKKDVAQRDAKLIGFFSNLFAAVLATMASSPWNFVRSVAYSTPPHAVGLHRAMVVRFLLIQAKYAFEHGETYRKIAYHSSECTPRGRHFMAAFRVINRRLNVGWGSLRVGLGMAVGQHVFGLVQAAMVSSPSQHPSRRRD